MVKIGKLFSNKPDVELQPAVSDQSPLIADLHTKLFRRGWSADECASLISQNTVFGFVARPINQSKPLGFVLSRVIADEAEILSIGTDQRAQNQGLGWRMMQAVIGEASKRGAKKLFLEVDENNEPAVILYKKIGFKTVGKRQAYYDNGEDAKSNALVLEFKLN
ncbi:MULTISPECIES: GNAT family N-acetyltransferase [unclassified Lentilitoribacter]|jgi:ribosomal-protein-alanine N-acetyltransferase|uniref:GNAT family N-acetyltransferase n=1 Tax=unclassified Lentilitoribacter TaxID=2647570 RepID=UPI0013A69236|nr:N-acetyltransferase [Lentilitoribacter sp. Alg239-R112]